MNSTWQDAAMRTGMLRSHQRCVGGGGGMKGPELLDRGISRERGVDGSENRQ